MADKTNENPTADKRSGEPDQPAQIGLVTWLASRFVIAAISGSGFVVGRLMAGNMQKQAAGDETAQGETDEQNPDGTPRKEKAQKGDEGTWYYNDLESVVVNPDEPGATRFVRVGLILEISSELSQEKATQMIQGKSPRLINWLNLYFKSLSLDQMENERDMKRILSHICDGFNDILFPEAKPQIQSVLIREFNIQ
mgnify:CR=1 FL=1